MKTYSELVFDNLQLNDVDDDVGEETGRHWLDVKSLIQNQRQTCTVGFVRDAIWLLSSMEKEW